MAASATLSSASAVKFSSGWIHHHHQPGPDDGGDHYRRGEADHAGGEHVHQVPEKGEVGAQGQEAEEVDQPVDHQPSQHEEQDVQGFSQALPAADQKPEQQGQEEEQGERIEKDNVHPAQADDEQGEAFQRPECGSGQAPGEATGEPAPQEKE